MKLIKAAHLIAKDIMNDTCEPLLYPIAFLFLLAAFMIIDLIRDFKMFIGKVSS